jgi:hypothetical protein
MLASVLAETE